MSKMNKFVLSTLVAAAAMTSTAWAEGTILTPDVTLSSENVMKDAFGTAGKIVDVTNAVGAAWVYGNDNGGEEDVNLAASSSYTITGGNYQNLNEVYARSSDSHLVLNGAKLTVGKIIAGSGSLLDSKNSISVENSYLKAGLYTASEAWWTMWGDTTVTIKNSVVGLRSTVSTDIEDLAVGAKNFSAQLAFGGNASLMNFGSAGTVNITSSTFVSGFFQVAGRGQTTLDDSVLYLGGTLNVGAYHASGNASWGSDAASGADYNANGVATLNVSNGSVVYNIGWGDGGSPGNTCNLGLNIGSGKVVVSDGSKILMTAETHESVSENITIGTNGILEISGKSEVSGREISNAGTIFVNDSTLSAETIANSGAIVFNGGDNTFDSTISGNGKVQVASGTLTLTEGANVSGLVSVGGTGEVPGGVITEGDSATLTIGKGATLTNSAQYFWVGSGWYSETGDQDAAAENKYFLNITGGTLDDNSGEGFRTNCDGQLTISDAGKAHLGAFGLQSKGNSVSGEGSLLEFFNWARIWETADLTIKDGGTLYHKDITEGDNAVLTVDGTLNVENGTANVLRLDNNGTLTVSGSTVKVGTLAHKAGKTTFTDVDLDVTNFVNGNASSGTYAVIGGNSKVHIDSLSGHYALRLADGVVLKDGTSIKGTTSVRAIGDVTFGESATDSIHINSFDNNGISSEGCTITVNGTLSVSETGKEYPTYWFGIKGGNLSTDGLTTLTGEGVVNVNTTAVFQDGNLLMEEGLTINITDVANAHLRFTDADMTIKGRIDKKGYASVLNALTRSSVTVTGNKGALSVQDDLHVGYSEQGYDIENAYKSTLNVTDGAQLTVVGTTYVNLESNINVDNAVFTTGTITNNGKISLTDSVLFVKDITNNGTFTMDGGTLEVTGTATLDGTVSINADEVILAGTIAVDELTTKVLTIAESDVVINITGVSAVMTLAADEEAGTAGSGLSFETLKFSTDNESAVPGGDLDLETLIADETTRNLIQSQLNDGDLITIENTATGVTYTDCVYSNGAIAVPEPSAFGLLAGLGAIALAVSRRRRNCR